MTIDDIIFPAVYIAVGAIILYVIKNMPARDIEPLRCKSHTCQRCNHE